MKGKVNDTIAKYNDVSKVISRFIGRQNELEEIEAKHMKYTGNVTLADSSFYASYNRTLEISLNSEQRERLGGFIKEMLEEELEELRQEVEGIDIIK